MGRRYHGYPNGRLVTAIHESVTTNFVAHPATTLKTASAPAAKTKTLRWNANSYELK